MSVHSRLLKTFFLVTLFFFTFTHFSEYTYAYHEGWDKSEWEDPGAHKTTQNDDPEKPIPPKERERGKGGDPVDLKSGNFIHSQQDLLIPGRGPSIDITRTYNTQDMHTGYMGYGWHMEYFIKLVRVLGTDPGSSLPVMYVIIDQGDGVRLEFKENYDRTYSPPPGRYDRLERDPSDRHRYTLTKPDGTKYHFFHGRLEKIVDRNRNELTFSYNLDGTLEKVTDDSGRTIRFSYSIVGWISMSQAYYCVTRISGPGRTVRYGYDEDANLIRVTDPAGNTTRYSYNDEHRLISIEDPRGNTFLELTYDDEGRVFRQLLNGGTYSFTYAPDKNRTSVTNPRGFETTFYYNDTGNITEEVDPLGNRISRSWDASMNLTSMTDANDNETNYGYDAMGNLTRVTDPQGNITTYTYEHDYNQVTSITDPLGRVTRFEYDSKGNLTKTIDALGNQTTSTYDFKGDLLTMTNAAGKTTSYGYDSYGNPVAITDPLGNTAHFSYDVLGNRTSVTDQNGNTTRYAYDELNRLTQITDALGNIMKYTYDKNGNRTNIIDALASTTTFIYNAYNQLIARTDALGNQTFFTYDENSNSKTVTDAEGNTTTNAYDALDRLIKATDALGNATEYTYDGNGNQKSIRDANGNTTTYAYDSLNRLTKTIYPNGSMETYTYDKVGNRISKTDQKGKTIIYSYDNLNRLIIKTYPDSTQVTYTYDAVGNLISTANGNSTISYVYDALKRIIQVTQDTETVGYEYDPIGNRTKLIYPDGTYVTYTYDTLNRLNQIKDATGQTIADYAYDNLSRRTQLDLANGTQTLYQYDLINRLTNLTNRIVATQDIISSFAYTYDRVGNRSSMTTAEGIHHYTYDKTYQLTNVDYPDAYPFLDMTYNFDAMGNRTSTVNDRTANYTTNNMNQYTDVEGSTYTYDANGNLSSDGINTYFYDYENRLIQVATPTSTITFSYDPFGRRISKTVDSVTTSYLHDGDQVVVGYDGSGQITRLYIYGPGIDPPVCMKTGAALYYYHFDGLGSVIALTGASCNVVGTVAYTPYGEADHVSSVENPYLYTGREYDAETGLYFYRARYYDAKLGRFLQTDPAGYSDGLNLYSYVSNNPCNWIDPYGLCKAEGKGIWIYSGYERSWFFLFYGQTSRTTFYKNLETGEIRKIITRSRKLGGGIGFTPVEFLSGAAENVPTPGVEWSAYGKGEVKVGAADIGVSGSVSTQTGSRSVSISPAWGTVSVTDNPKSGLSGEVSKGVGAGISGGAVRTTTYDMTGIKPWFVRWLGQ